MGDDWILSCPSREVVWKRPQWETHREDDNESSSRDEVRSDDDAVSLMTHAQQFTEKLEAWDVKSQETEQQCPPDETSAVLAAEDEISSASDVPATDTDLQRPVDSTIISAVIPFEDTLISSESEIEEAVSDVDECPVASFTSLKPVTQRVLPQENVPYEQDLLFCDRPFTEVEQYQHENYLLREELRDTRNTLSRQLTTEKDRLSTMVRHVSRFFGSLWH